MSDLSSLAGFVHLSPSEETALLHILENGCAYAYELAYHPEKRIRLVNGIYRAEKEWVFRTEKTANTALNSLARRRLLEKKLERSEAAKKEGRDRYYYYLTLPGLFLGLSILDERKTLNDKIDSIVKKWSSLLFPLFGYWKQFEEAGLNNCVVSLLKHSIMTWARVFLFPIRSYGNSQWNGEVEVSRNFAPDFFLEIIAQTLTINPFGGGRVDYLGCSINDCGKPHSIGCLVEHDRILSISPELLKVTQEYCRKVEENIKRDLKHYEIKTQISKMLGNPSVDWSEINRLERLIAEYRCLTPSYYTR